MFRTPDISVLVASAGPVPDIVQSGRSGTFPCGIRYVNETWFDEIVPLSVPVKRRFAEGFRSVIVPVTVLPDCVAVQFARNASPDACVPSRPCHVPARFSGLDVP